MSVGDSRGVLAQRAEPDLSQVLLPRQEHSTSVYMVIDVDH